MKTKFNNIFLTQTPPAVCKPFSIEKDKLQAYFIENGSHIVEDHSKADLVVLHSCGATNSAEKSTIEHLNNLHRRKPAVPIFVTGCLGRINPDFANAINNVKLIKDYSQLDAILNAKKPFKAFPSIKLESKEKTTQKRFPRTFFPLNFIIPFYRFIKNPLLLSLIDSATMRDRILLDISSGCTDNCSYCAIKLAKGEHKSIPINEIINSLDINDPEEQHFISLVAQDCGVYGKDIGTSLVELLEQILSRIPKAVFEITTVNPKWLIEDQNEWEYILSNFPIKEIAIPYQSGSNKVLKLMNRKYSVEEIAPIVTKLRKISPSTVFRNHIIAGFPGETWGDYLKSFTIINLFDHNLIQPMNIRPGTAAYKMKGKLPKATVMLRYWLLKIFADCILIRKILVTKLKNSSSSLS